MPTQITYNLSSGRPAGKGGAGDGAPDDARGFVYTSILQQASPELADEVHATDGYKPFTVSRLFRPMRSSDDGGRGLHRRALRLTALTDEIADAFFTGFATYLASGEPIRIGDTLLEIDDELGPVTLQGQVSYPELADGALADLVVLRAISPAAFSDGGRQVPLPVAGPCFVSLRRKWNAFAPSELRIPDEVEDAFRESVGVCRHDISSRSMRTRTHLEIGFVGVVGFRLMSRDAELQRWFGALGRFAEYAGLGVHTTLGMGQTRCIAPRSR